MSAFFSSCLAAAIEGRLFSAELGVLPLWANFSTLLDFLLINPLGIYYILRSYQAMNGCKPPLTIRGPSNRSSIALAILALFCMSIYAYHFLDGSFRDATVIGKGLGSVTIAGWLLFGWTAVFLYLVFECVANQIHYVRKVADLAKSGLDYEPFHPDRSGGMSTVVRPALEFLRVMVVLLFMFVVFYLYDHVIHDIHASNRLDFVLLYLAVAPPLFLSPVLILHRAMCKARDKLLEPLNAQMLMAIARIKDGDPCVRAAEMEALAKMKKEIEGFPVWPLPVRQMIESASYLVGPALSYLPKELHRIISG
jgi:hypothetical protein